MHTTRVINKRMIVGLGMTGLSAARWCQRNGFAFDLCDTRSTLADVDSVKKEFRDSLLLLGDEVTGDILSDYDELVVSPGVALSTAAIQQAISNGVAISGDIDLFRRHCEKPIIGITGSNGKSTVTTLVGELLKAAGKSVAIGGNIGVPALDLPEADIYVLELSSFQLETTADLAAEVAVILNLSEDHMDRYQGMNDYLQAKQRIFQKAGHVVVNRDEQETLAPDHKADMSFGLSEPQNESEFGLRIIDGERYICRGSSILIAASGLNIKGLHNLGNVMAALALVSLVNVTAESVLDCLKSFAGLDHRCQWLGEKNGVAFYNDSKGTNVASTLAAINGLGPEITGKVLLLAGGVGKGQDFSPLNQACSQYVREVFTFGRDRNQIQSALSGSSAVVSDWKDIDTAFTAARNVAQEGDAILLSPACASFDQFKNYVDRGNYFRTQVEAVL